MLKGLQKREFSGLVGFVAVLVSEKCVIGILLLRLFLNVLINLADSLSSIFLVVW